MDGIQIQGVSGRQGDEGVARQELIVRPMRRVRPLQHPDPFGIANLGIGKTRQAQAIILRDRAICVERRIPVQVQVEAELIGTGSPVIHEHRRPGKVKQIGDILLKISRTQWRVTVGIIVIINVGQIG